VEGTQVIKKQKTGNPFLILALLYILCFAIRSMLGWVPMLGILLRGSSDTVQFMGGGSMGELYFVMGAEAAMVAAAIITTVKNSGIGTLILMVLLAIEAIPGYFYFNFNAMVIVICVFGYLQVNRAGTESRGPGREDGTGLKAWKCNPYFLCGMVLAAVTLAIDLAIPVIAYFGLFGVQSDGTVDYSFIAELILQLCSLIVFYLAAKKNRKLLGGIGLLMQLGSFAIAYVPNVSYLFGSPSSILWNFLVFGILSPAIVVPAIGLLRKEKPGR